VLPLAMEFLDDYFDMKLFFLSKIDSLIHQFPVLVIEFDWFVGLLIVDSLLLIVEFVQSIDFSGLRFLVSATWFTQSNLQSVHLTLFLPQNMNLEYK
jgi:hypothetical protein